MRYIGCVRDDKIMGKNWHGSRLFRFVERIITNSTRSVQQLSRPKGLRTFTESYTTSRKPPKGLGIISNIIDPNSLAATHQPCDRKQGSGSRVPRCHVYDLSCSSKSSWIGEKADIISFEKYSTLKIQASFTGSQPGLQQNNATCTMRYFAKMK